MYLRIKIKLVIVLGIISFISSYSYSQGTITLTDIEEQFISEDSLNPIKFADYIYIYKDTTKSLSIEQVSSKKFDRNFIPFNKNKNFYNNIFYWAKISIDIGKSTDIKLIMRLRGSEYFNIYIPTKENKFLLKKTGIYMPTSENDEIANFTNIIIIELKKEIGDSSNVKTLFIKFHTKTFSPRLYLDIVDLATGIKITTQKLDETKKEQFLNGLYHGILLFIFLFGISLFFLQKNIDNLYYSLYVLCISIFSLSMNGLATEMILYNFRQYDFFFTNVSAFIAFIFYSQFLKNVLDKGKRLKWLRWAINFLIISLIVLIILAISLLVLFENVGFYLNIIRPTSPILFLIYAAINFRLIFLKDKVSSMIAISTLVLFSSLLYTTFTLFIDLPYSYEILQAGILIQVLVFAYILIYKIKLSEDLKKQAQVNLIFQLQENKKLQTKVNRELEQKVKERTIQISERNDELQQRNEEIKLQRDEILNKSELLEQQNEEIKTQSEFVNEQNVKISDSILYAKKIQSAVLPHQAYIDVILPENFILLKPRDVVSGDFYWVKQVNHYIVIAAADCTGHGVPGAILSMLGISFLNEIVQKREITQAKQVLNELRKQIKQALRQTGKKGEADDGMDISLCVLETKTKKLQYAGANNPLYLIQNDELTEIKADRMPIGYYPNEKPTFTNHEIQLNDGDIFYLFSDGFMDQFGGKKGFKYKAPNFQKRLLENHNKPMVIQKELLEQELKNWMKGYEQTDDILVMGVRV